MSTSRYYSEETCSCDVSVSVIFAFEVSQKCNIFIGICHKCCSRDFGNRAVCSPGISDTQGSATPPGHLEMGRDEGKDIFSCGQFFSKRQPPNTINKYLFRTGECSDIFSRFLT